METNRSGWNILETTVSYKAWARLTPTLTHVVTYELVTSGAEDDAMSGRLDTQRRGDVTGALGQAREVATIRVCIICNNTPHNHLREA